MNTYSILKRAGMFLLLVISFSGCVKDPDEPEEETPAPTTPTPVFNWSVNNGTAVSGDDAFYVAAYNEIYGNKNGVTIVDIILDTIAKKTYNISQSAGITLDYFDGTTSRTAKSGIVTISEINGTRISGSYNCTFTGGTITSVSGQFSNLPKK